MIKPEDMRSSHFVFARLALIPTIDGTGLMLAKRMFKMIYFEGESENGARPKNVAAAQAMPAVMMAAALRRFMVETQLVVTFPSRVIERISI